MTLAAAMAFYRAVELADRHQVEPCGLVRTRPVRTDRVTTEAT
ncbi:hypothetical protein [Aeromicrobium sp. UC242_57]